MQSSHYGIFYFQERCIRKDRSPFMKYKNYKTHTMNNTASVLVLTLHMLISESVDRHAIIISFHCWLLHVCVST